MPAEAPAAPPPAPAKPASQPSAPAKPESPPPLNSLSMYDEIDKLVLDNAEAENEKTKPSDKNAKLSTDKQSTSDKTESSADDGRVDEDSDEEKALSGKPGKPEASSQRLATEQVPTKAKELREAYESTKKERDLLKAEIDTLKKQSPKEDPERAAITERLTKEEKRRQELEEEIKHLNYERSTEYKEKFQDPISKAYQHACEEIKEYIVTEDNGNERQATVDDFSAVMRLPPGEVVSRTKTWFGDAAPEVRALRRNILELDRKAAEAVKEYKDKGAEIETRRTTEQLQTRQRAEQLWEAQHKEALEKHPELFGPKEGDDDRNKLLESGYAMADMHFNPPKDLPLEKRVSLAAQIRHRTAGFAPLVLENRRLKEQLAAKEAELKEFRDSEPGKGDGERVPTKGPKTYEQEIEEAAGIKTR